MIPVPMLSAMAQDARLLHHGTKMALSSSCVGDGVLGMHCGDCACSALSTHSTLRRHVELRKVLSSVLVVFHLCA